MDSIRYHELPVFFQGAAEIFAEKKEELCKTDAEMGDGDLGLTIEEGFGTLSRSIRENGEDGNTGRTSTKADMKIFDLVPSTMGALATNGTIEGAKVLGGKTEMGLRGFSEFLDGFARGIERRGECRPGDRTLSDATDAAAKKALKASKDGVDMVTVIHATVEGIRVDAATTKNMLSKFGKAVVFSAKAKGIPDQEAVAGQYLLEEMKRYSPS